MRDFCVVREDLRLCKCAGRDSVCKERLRWGQDGNIVGDELNRKEEMMRSRSPLEDYRNFFKYN